MIDKREILEQASALGLLPNIVEKDYVLGWVLAGIDTHPVLGKSWIFKGGTCLKKCYFETYRFSEDLDFTLRDESQLTDTYLRSALAEVVAWVADESGLSMPADQIGLDIYTNPRGRPACQGRIAYRGPVSPPGGGWPKIKVDLTADEKLVLPEVHREVFHPYSDRPDAGMWVNCYAYEEAFGEKIRALGERTRPRDLYDVVNLYRHGDNRPPASILRNVLAQKCAYKAIAVPTANPSRRIARMSRRCGRACSPINSPYCHRSPTFGARSRKSSPGSPAGSTHQGARASSPTQLISRSGAVCFPSAFRHPRARRWRSSGLRRRTDCASIFATTVLSVASSLTRYASRAKVITYFTPYDQTLASIGPTAWTGFKARP